MIIAERTLGWWAALAMLFVFCIQGEWVPVVLTMILIEVIEINIKVRG